MEQIETFRCHSCNHPFVQYGSEFQFITIPTLENGVSYKRHFCLKCANAKSSHPIPIFAYPIIPNRTTNSSIHEAGTTTTAIIRDQAASTLLANFERRLAAPSQVQVHQVQNQLAHKCHLCSKSFDKSIKLRLHKKRVHEDLKIKDKKCDFCGKPFGSKQVLDRHINSVHRGLKEFSCKMCDKSYTQSHSLNYHVKIHHEGMKAEKRYKCDLCEKAFTQSHSLKDHQKKAHIVYGLDTIAR